MNELQVGRLTYACKVIISTLNSFAFCLLRGDARFLREPFLLSHGFGALAFCGVLSTYIGIVEYRHAMHPHEHEDIAYSHMKIRAKPYPWDCPDCNLFESQCFRDCKAAAKE